MRVVTGLRRKLWRSIALAQRQGRGDYSICADPVRGKMVTKAPSTSASEEETAGWTFIRGSKDYVGWGVIPDSRIRGLVRIWFVLPMQT